VQHQHSAPPNWCTAAWPDILCVCCAQVADPECRAVAARAAKELMRVANEGKTVPPKKADPSAVTAALKELIAARNPSVAGDAVFGPTLSYVAGLVASLQVSSTRFYQCSTCSSWTAGRWMYVACAPFLFSTKLASMLPPWSEMLH
jgi:hypothetical protein